MTPSEEIAPHPLAGDKIEININVVSQGDVNGPLALIPPPTKAAESAIGPTAAVNIIETSVCRRETSFKLSPGK